MTQLGKGQKKEKNSEYNHNSAGSMYNVDKIEGHFGFGQRPIYVVRLYSYTLAIDTVSLPQQKTQFFKDAYWRRFGYHGER